MGSRSSKEDPIRRKVGDVDPAAKKQFNKDFANLGKPAAPRPAPKPMVPAPKNTGVFSVFRARRDLKERGHKVDAEVERQTK